MKTTIAPISGFSLIELLIVLAIFGILLKISYPVYTQHLQKTRRAQAQIALLDLAAGMERYHAIEHSYRNATLAEAGVNEYTQGNYYQLQITRANDEDYLLQAIPHDAEVKCGTLGLDQQGRRMASGSESIEACWN